jgi:hypothetical protein
MGEWPIIRMTQARQVAELMEIERGQMPDEGVGVQDFYRQARLRSAVDALDVIGHALPRFEAVCWAAEVLDRESRKRELPPPDRQALDSSLRWTGEPDDANRRAAYAAAESAADSGPERLLGLAVFLSGGSLSEPELPPVLPEPGTCCRLAVAAVKVAGYRNSDPEPLFAEALELAEGVAQRGVAALRPV